MRVSSLVAALKRNNLFKYFTHKIFKTTVFVSKENILEDCIFYKQEFPFIKYQTTEFAPAINALFNKWAFSGELEYLVLYNKKGMIEPHHGWFVNSSNEIIQKSLPYGETLITPIPDYILYVKKKIINIDKVVSIRYNWFNYWHFYNDVIGQLYLLDKNNFDKNIPIVVPKEALKLSHVKYFFDTEYAKKWNWIFQDYETFIKVNAIYFCKSIPNIKAQFVYGANIFKKNKPSPISAHKKIFITRKQNRGRTLNNINEISELLKQHKFEIIDCDDLSIEEQIMVFSSASIIVGIHGAGLTNIVYRYPNDCTLIEIFPPDMTPTHYYWLAKELGFNYNAVLGTGGDRNLFSVDEKDVENILNSMDSYNLLKNL